MRPWAQESKAGWGEAATPNRPPRTRVVVGNPAVVGYDDGRILYGRSEAAQAQGAQP